MNRITVGRRCCGAEKAWRRSTAAQPEMGKWLEINETNFRFMEREGNIRKTHWTPVLLQPYLLISGWSVRESIPSNEIAALKTMSQLPMIGL